MKLVFIILLVFLTACSNTPDAKQQAKDDAAYSSDYANYAKASKVATINVDDDGKIKSIDIGNQNLQAPQRKQYQDGFGQTLVKETFSTIRTGIGVVANPTTALAVAAIEMNKRAGGNTTNSNSYNQHSEANQANTHSEANQANSTVSNTTNTTNTNSYNQTAESNNQNNPVTNTDNTNNSVNESNNSKTVQPPSTESQEEGNN